MKKSKLPNDYRPYIDKYFLRAKEILIADNLNPIVKYQVFIREGHCGVFGINEAIELIKKYCSSKYLEIYSLSEGDYIVNGECIMTIKAPIQDIIDLETMYLGVVSSNTTSINNPKDDIDNYGFNQITKNIKTISELIFPREVIYFGARHWHWNRDAEIAKACFNGGADNCSTDAGAIAGGKKEGVGTIPHSLEAIYHWKYGLEQAVFQSTIAFNKHIDKNVPTCALIDYANREINDSLSVLNYANAVRVDTCGENYMQGIQDIDISKNYWFWNGVSIYGTYLLRTVLPRKIKIILSSGFGDIYKVETFINAEKELNIQLFDSLGIGGVYPSKIATSDIVEVNGVDICKVGRTKKDFSRLTRIV